MTENKRLHSLFHNYNSEKHVMVYSDGILHQEQMYMYVIKFLCCTY